MSGRLPVQVDPLDLADKSREIEGAVAVSAFRRLGNWLHSDEGTIAAALAFTRDSAGRRKLRGRLSGDLELECQRCLGVFTFPVACELDLVLVETEADARLLPEEMESQVVGTRRGVHTIDLIEDELILSLPLVARCADHGNDCQPATNELSVSEEDTGLVNRPDTD